MSLLFEKTSLSLKFFHLRNKISTLLLKFASVQVPACTHHHGVQIEGLESSGRGWATKTKPNFDSPSPACKNELNPQWNCAMFKQLLKLSQGSFSLSFPLVVDVSTDMGSNKLLVPFSSYDASASWSRDVHVLQKALLGPPAGVRLLLHCWRKKTLAATPAPFSDSETSCHSQEAMETLFQASLAVLDSHPLVKSLAGIKNWVKPCWRHYWQRRGSDFDWLSHLLERNKLYQTGIFPCSPITLSRTLASKLCWWVGSLPCVWFSWICFLQLCRNSSQINLEAVQHVWGSQICDISTCDDSDVVAVAIPDVPRAHMQGFAQFPEITALPHSTHRTGKNKPSNNFDSLQKQPHPFSLHSSDSSVQGWKKPGPEQEGKKKGIKIKFNEIVSSSRLSPKYIRNVAPFGTSFTTVWSS